MSEKMKGLTLNHLKFSETSAILNVYTIDYGFLSLLIKGFYAKKKKIQVCTYPFTEIEFILSPNTDKEKLISTYTLEILNFYDDIFSHPVKMLQVQLVAEILTGILKNEPGNRQLYQKIKTLLRSLGDKNSNFADFHLFFIKEVAEQLGLNPNIANINGLYFNIKDSEFIDFNTEDFNLDLETTRLIKKLFLNQFKENTMNIFNQQQRNVLLNALLKYFEFHIPNFKTPKSIEILKVLLN